MRVISQDKAYDLPYETTLFLINKKTCEIEAVVSDNFEPVMAIYSTVDRCVKAMELLQDSYASNFMYSTMNDMQRSLYATMVKKR